MEVGHADAADYPLGMMWDELILVTERHNSRLVADAVLLQAALASVHSKKAGSSFQKRVKGLNVETKALDSGARFLTDDLSGE